MERLVFPNNSQIYEDDQVSDLTLLDIEAMGKSQWFEKFDKLDDSLAQVLLLIALT